MKPCRNPSTYFVSLSGLPHTWHILAKNSRTYNIPGLRVHRARNSLSSPPCLPSSTRRPSSRCSRALMMAMHAEGASRVPSPLPPPRTAIAHYPFRALPLSADHFRFAACVFLLLRGGCTWCFPARGSVNVNSLSFQSRHPSIPSPSCLLSSAPRARPPSSVRCRHRAGGIGLSSSEGSAAARGTTRVRSFAPAGEQRDSGTRPLRARQSPLGGTNGAISA